MMEFVTDPLKVYLPARSEEKTLLKYAVIGRMSPPNFSV